MISSGLTTKQNITASNGVDIKNPITHWMGFPFFHKEATVTTTCPQTPNDGKLGLQSGRRGKGSSAKKLISQKAFNLLNESTYQWGQEWETGLPVLARKQDIEN